MLALLERYSRGHSAWPVRLDQLQQRVNFILDLIVSEARYFWLQDLPNLLELLNGEFCHFAQLVVDDEADRLGAE